MADAVAVNATAAMDAEFEKVGVQGYVHARDLESGREISLNADTQVVLASTFKVPVLVELVRQFEAGILDPEERLRVPAEGRTGGGTGLSALVDEVELSLRDLAQLMISVSDNAATDIVMERVGRDAVNKRMRDLGLEHTFLEGDCKFLLARVMEDVKPTEEEQAALESEGEDAIARIPRERWLACRDIQGETTNRSTPREMTRLLELIWKDEAAPAQGCALARRILGQQVWPHRLRAGFEGAVKTSGKTGTLPLIRNEIGVLEFPDGGRYAVAVFTVAEDARLVAPDRDRVIGTVAHLAVEQLRASQ